jgi:hypothetical protein
MGSGVVVLPNAWDRLRMGFLRADEMAVADPAVGATFDIAALDSDGPGTRILLLRRPSGGYLAIDYRRSGGPFDAMSGTGDAAGVFIRVVDGDDDTTSSLVDAHPATTSMADAYLTAGSAMDDSVDGFAIGVTSVDGAAAHISITSVGSGNQGVLPNPPSPPVPPTPPIQPSADVNPPSAVGSAWAVVKSASKVTIKWTRAFDDVAVVRYKIRFRNGRTLFTSRLKVTVRMLNSGPHSLTVAAIDLAGNTGPATTVSFTN